VRRMVAGLLAAIWIVGCTGMGPGPGEVTLDPASKGPSTSPKAQEWLPGVPVHPAAESKGLAVPQRAYMRVVGKGAAEVLSWYISGLSSQGWTAVPTVLPKEYVLLVTKNGQYLSLSAHDAPGGNTVVWFHLRSNVEVTADEALAIASAADLAAAEWTASYMAEFESDAYGSTFKHPVWIVKGRQEGTIRTVVHVDAITAEPLQINTID